MDSGCFRFQAKMKLVTIYIHAVCYSKDGFEADALFTNFKRACSQLLLS